MTQMKCSICGTPIDVPPGAATVACPFCSTVNAVSGTQAASQIYPVSQPAAGASTFGVSSFGMPQSTISIDSLLRHIRLYLEDGDWQTALMSAGQIIAQQPGNAQAHLYKLMAELQVNAPEALSNHPTPLETEMEYQSILRCGDAQAAELVTRANSAIKERIRLQQLDQQYSLADALEKNEHYVEARDAFAALGRHRDANNRRIRCQQKLDAIAEALRREQLARAKAEQEALNREQAAQVRQAMAGMRIKQEQQQQDINRKNRFRFLVAVLVLALLAGIGFAAWQYGLPLLQQQLDYDAARQHIENRQYSAAIPLYAALGDYRDSAELLLDARYQYACSLKAEGQYAEAQELYRQLSGYRDAGEQAAQCAQMLIPTAVPTAVPTVMPTAAPVPINQSGYVNLSSAALYEQPSDTARKLSDLPLNTTLTVVAMQTIDGRAWYSVTINGQSGYLPQGLVTLGTPSTPTPSPTATSTHTSVITASPTPSPRPINRSGYICTVSATLRSAPDNASPLLRQLSKYDQVYVLEEQKLGSLWYKVRIDEQTGYLYKTTVSLGDAPTATPSPTPRITPAPTVAPTATPRIINQKGYISAASAALRKTASSSGTMLAVLPLHTPLRVLEAQTIGDTAWYKVEATGKTGYVPAGSVTLGDAPTPTPTPTRTPTPEIINREGYARFNPVNVWNQPSTIGSSVIATLSKDDAVHVAHKLWGSDGQPWYQVQVNGRTGYVSSSFIRLSTATATPTSKPATPTPTAKSTVKPADLRKGDTIQFGNYRQGYASTKSAIKWTVLAVQDSKALLISQQALYSMPYQDAASTSSWAASDIRTWLNSTFYNAAFSAAEKAAILQSQITTNGRISSDRLFLLSSSEAKQYFTSASVRRCKPTTYAVTSGAYKDSTGYGWWWLRDVVSGGKNAYIVQVNGDVRQTGYSIKVEKGGIRPAMWIDLTKYTGQ